MQPFWRGPESCLKKCSLGNLAKQQGGGWWLQWVHRHIWCPGYVRIFQGRRSRNIFLIIMSCIWNGSPQTWIVPYFFCQSGPSIRKPSSFQLLTHQLRLRLWIRLQEFVSDLREVVITLRYLQHGPKRVGYAVTCRDSVLASLISGCPKLVILVGRMPFWDHRSRDKWNW